MPNTPRTQRKMIIGIGVAWGVVAIAPMVSGYFFGWRKVDYRCTGPRNGSNRTWYLILAAWLLGLCCCLGGTIYIHLRPKTDAERLADGDPPKPTRTPDGFGGFGKRNSMDKRDGFDLYNIHTVMCCTKEVPGNGIATASGCERLDYWRPCTDKDNKHTPFGPYVCNAQVPWFPPITAKKLICIPKALEYGTGFGDTTLEHAIRVAYHGV